MLYNVVTTRNFERAFKRLVKKYVSLSKEYEQLIDELEVNPGIGIPLGNNLFKIRLAIASKCKGKSGGARVITYLRTKQETVWLLSIYDKGEKNTMSDIEIQNILEGALER